jgi:dTDP-glucose pyrophosphorylase
MIEFKDSMSKLNVYNKPIMWLIEQMTLSKIKLIMIFKGKVSNNFQQFVLKRAY